MGHWNTDRAGNVERGFCAFCGEFLVDAWICVHCACDYNIGPVVDSRWSSAGAVARAAQRRLERDVGHEQWMAIVSVPDSGIVPYGGDSATRDHEHARYKRTRHALRVNHLPLLSRDEARRQSRDVPEALIDGNSTDVNVRRAARRAREAA